MMKNYGELTKKLRVLLCEAGKIMLSAHGVEAEGDIDEKSGLFRNEYVEENVDETDLGDGISDSDFDDILSLFKKD